jgi:Carboxypeptidase regulatory-like domain
MRNLSILVLFIFAAGKVFGCQCVDSQPACAAFWTYQAGAVFAGTVLKITEPERGSESFPQRTVLLGVDRGYAGVSAKEIEIHTGRGGGDCGYPFQAGHRYLVYALPNPNDHVLRASICSPTKKIEDAGEDLAYLNNLQRLPKSSRIFGVVADPWKDRDHGFAHTTVELIGVSGSQKVLTDGAGRFDVSGLAAGRYRIHVAVPGYTLGNGTRGPEIDVHEGGCAAVQMWLSVDGRISGKVFDSEGRGVPRIRVDLLKPEDQFPSFGAETDATGRYEFGGVRSGKYRIAVNSTSGPSAEQPYAPAFYPDVHQFSKAALVTLGEAEHREDLNLHLGPKLRQKEFPGRVYYPDGTAAGNANVVYRLVDSASATAVQSAKDGSFRFTGFEGSLFQVTASSNSGVGFFQSEPVETPAEGNAELRIMLKLVRNNIGVPGYSLRPNAQDPKLKQ